METVCDLYFQKYPEQLNHKNFHHAVQLLDEAPEITRNEVKLVELHAFHKNISSKYEKSVMCIPPKTGTTNWQFVSIALRVAEQFLIVSSIFVIFH